MKKLLLLLIMICGLVACASASNDITEGVSDAQIRRLSGDAAIGTPRISFAIMDGVDPMTDIQAVTLQAKLLEAENDDLVWAGTAVNYTDYEIPYWVAYPDVPEAGFWGVTATIAKADGSTIESDFIIDVQAESESLPLGTPAPPSQNRTLATEPDISKLNSGENPNPELYQLTVAEALQNNKPTIVGFITPGLCQTEWCTPVLESVETTRTEIKDEINTIHIEVYEDFDTLQLVPQLAEWGLQTEPWVFVLDENGRITAKFEGPLSPQELNEAIQPLLQ